jgi:energy-converting hydrogenase A subunit M
MSIKVVSYDPSKVDHDMTEVMAWLVENIGHGVLEDTDAWRLDIRWSAWINPRDYSYMIEFKSQEDAMLFNMRWL